MEKGFKGKVSYMLGELWKIQRKCSKCRKVKPVGEFGEYKQCSSCLNYCR